MPAQDDVSLQSSHRIFSASPPTPRQLAPSHDQKLTCMGVLIESSQAEQWTCLGYRDKALRFDVISVNTSDNTCQHVRIESSQAEHWTQSSRQGSQVLMLTLSHFVHAFSNLHAHFRPCQHHGAYLSIKTSPWMCLDACLLSSVCFLRVCWDFMTNLFGDSRNQFVSLCLCFAKLESCCKN